MSQLENIIELIRTVNEVYFITAPLRVRAAYILVDDIVELALKSYLQLYTHNQRDLCRQDLESNTPILLINDNHRNQLNRYFREEIAFPQLAQALGLNGQRAINELHTRLNSFGNLQHWSANNPNAHIDFGAIVREVKNLFQQNNAIQTPLDDLNQRHEYRNRLYHDHQHTAWSISDLNCLQAMCDLFKLVEILFPDFQQALQRPQNNTVRCQIGVLRLKLAATEGRQELIEPYNEALDQLKLHHRFDLEPRSVEHSIVHTVSERFFRTLENQFRNKIAELQSRVQRIDSMTPGNQRSRRAERDDKEQLINILQQQLDTIDALLA